MVKEVFFINIKTNSKKVVKGDTFVALKGIKNDGHKFIEEAIENGASLIVAEYGIYKVDTVIVPNTHEYLCEYLNNMYSYIFDEIKLIGITGTNGKTTTAYLTSKALNELGIACGYIGTIGFYIDDKIKELNNTTPDILEIYEMLLTCYERKCKYVVMEVSSQALAMHRLDGLKFDYGVFTNLTEDHLDYHKTMKEYAVAKQKLFQNIKKNGFAIINNDDEYKNYYLLNNNNLTYGFSNSDYIINNYKIENNILSFTLNDEKYSTNLLGKYNAYNISIVIILLKLIGYEYEDIKNILIKLEAPSGRMEKIKYKDNLIIVDYAHTPDAVEKIINAVKEFSSGKIITLIGCGGNRDKNKRPIMADVATTLSDYVIFTSDNPRNEKPEDIINDMISNLTKNNYEVEINRKEAINKGIQKLEKNDILLLLGKGHEDYQIIGDAKYHFSDKEVALNIIRGE